MWSLSKGLLGINDFMLKKLEILLTMFVVSMYYFPINFTFLPGPNTKTIMAALGLFVCLIEMLAKKKAVIPASILGLLIMSGLVSLVGFISITYNKTLDVAYATYVISAAVWLSSSFVVCILIKRVHGYIDIVLLVRYLVAVCSYQCLAALLIAFVPSVQLFVDSFVQQGQGLLTEMGRMYGIGASLDTAGTRFSAAIILLTGLFVFEKERVGVAEGGLFIFLFLFIALVGSMIARTTYVGVVLGVLLLMVSGLKFDFNVSFRSIKLFCILVSLMTIVVATAVFLYNTNGKFYEMVRFAFEGFFNLFENGKYDVASNNKLMTMYVWPDNLKTWLIGDGYFSNPRSDINYLGNSTNRGFYMGTDVGYCRFVFYFGIAGISSFAAFLFYSASVCARAIPAWKLAFFFVLIANFIIWFKVATDLFVVFALIICVAVMADSNKNCGAETPQVSTIE